VFITGAENLYDAHDLQNMIYLLRSASIYMPPYLKFVLTAEKRESKADCFDRTIRILATTKVFDIQDIKFYENEGKTLLEFSYDFILMNNEPSKANVE